MFPDTPHVLATQEQQVYIDKASSNANIVAIKFIYHVIRGIVCL